MPSEPLEVAIRAHQAYMFLHNTDTYASYGEIYVDRVQSAEPTQTIRQDKSYELGRKGPTGASEDPPDFRFVWEENWAKWESALYQAGKDPSTDTSFNLGDIVDNTDVDIYVVTEDSDGVAQNEYVYEQSSLSELAMSWRMGSPITVRYTRDAINGKIYRQGALTHTARTALDDASPGSINPKDARVFFYSSGCTPADTDRVYRLQGFDITARFPSFSVLEIGRRDKVGVLIDPPDVSCTMDAQPGDDQPWDRFFDDAGTYLDLNTLQAQNGLIRIYDPEETEASSVLGSVVLENLKSTGGTPLRAQVRGLSTSRISADVSKEVTENSGGMICYVGDIP